ncbi:GTPase ObgE [Aerococcaceae bacterium NML201209]|nr:GTPase ObgE [Aerococcaceae bacterium NML201209]MCW6665054.1 GTPase ObgE [Aerococcaceae bacterium NML191219]MCW6675382.1 GTPase ObgE [Aerococcaceae bacterium NML171108]MCW6680718.1 GTPase ObgE [Aerococcaceae bacterium NML130460]
MSTFLDRARITVKAGKGGDGMVAFRREKYVPDGGPAGGDGGRGGSIIFRVDEGLRTLMDFRYNRHFKAKNGENGMSKSKYGAAAEDLVVHVPPGTIVRNAQTNALIADLVEQGQEIIVAKGGRGGRGNIKFATHKNPAPSIAENGEPGEEFDLQLELKVLADAGLVGYPSVGKSTLLSVISNAKPKIADYQFTTLTPNLGVVSIGYDREFVVADMPGLIEGASQGVGLGIHFLRHIERTKVLLHVIDMAATHERDPFQDFLDIMHELEAYNEKLLRRPMLIVANKMDEQAAQDNLPIFKEKLAAYCQEQEREPYEIFEISAWQTKGLQPLLLRTHDLVEHAEFVPLLEEEVVAQVHYGLEEEVPFEIHAIEPGYWQITGAKIEKLYAMTNMAHDESIARFARQMRSMGIDDALRELGAQAGDLVELSGYQFEFMD